MGTPFRLLRLGKSGSTMQYRTREIRGEGSDMGTLTRPLSDQDARVAGETSRRITELLQTLADDVDRVFLYDTGASHVTLEVPTGALELLRDILEVMGRGDSVTLVPYNKELTTQEAADLLNVSRPFVVRLIDEERIPARKVGTHRRLRLEDVMAYKRADDDDRQAIADELARDARELGIGYR